MRGGCSGGNAHSLRVVGANILASVCPLPPSCFGHIRTGRMVVSGFSRVPRVGLVGLLRRYRPARHKARPLRGLRFQRAHRSATPVFFRLARCVARRGCALSCSGLAPLRLLRGARRPPPCTPWRADAAGGVFHSILALRSLTFV